MLKFTKNLHENWIGYLFWIIIFILFISWRNFDYNEKHNEKNIACAVMKGYYANGLRNPAMNKDMLEMCTVYQLIGLSKITHGY